LFTIWLFSDFSLAYPLPICHCVGDLNPLTSDIKKNIFKLCPKRWSFFAPSYLGISKAYNTICSNLSEEINLKNCIQITGLYNSYQPPLALASKETFFTRQQKNVTCQINTDTNLYYTTTICIYSSIIIYPRRQKMLSWGMVFADIILKHCSCFRLL
jgi:hypothetical protein